MRLQATVRRKPKETEMSNSARTVRNLVNLGVTKCILNYGMVMRLWSSQIEYNGLGIHYVLSAWSQAYGSLGSNRILRPLTSLIN